MNGYFQKWLRLLLFLVLPAFLLAACAIFSGKKKPVLVERSVSSKPKWIAKLPKDDEDHFYFRGIKTGAKTPEGGLTDSKMNAIRQIVDFLGQEGIMTYEYLRESLRTEEKTRVKDEFKAKGMGIVRGVREKESYREKYEFPAGHDAIGYFYNVYILVTYNKLEYERAKKEVEALRKQREEEERRRKEEAARIERNKKKDILNAYQSGLAYLERGMVVRGIKSLVESRKLLKRYFPDLDGINITLPDPHPTLPLVGGGDAAISRIDSALIEDKITGAVGNITLSYNGGSILYTAKGKVTNNPGVSAMYNGRRPVSGLAIKASFAGDEGRIAPSPLLTRRDGSVSIPIQYVDPSSQDAAVEVSVDLQALGLAGDLALVQPPFCSISLDKTCSVAYWVNYSVNGRRKRLPALENFIKSALVNFGYDTVGPKEFKSRIGGNITHENLETMAGVKCDHVLVVTVSGDGGEKKGVLKGVFYANASARADAYSFLESRHVLMTEPKSASEYGKSLDEAALKAVSSLLPEFKKELKDKIHNMRCLR